MRGYVGDFDYFISGPIRANFNKLWSSPFLNKVILDDTIEKIQESCKPNHSVGNGHDSTNSISILTFFTKKNINLQLLISMKRQRPYDLASFSKIINLSPHKCHAKCYKWQTQSYWTPVINNFSTSIIIDRFG